MSAGTSDAKKWLLDVLRTFVVTACVAILGGYVAHWMLASDFYYAASRSRDSSYQQSMRVTGLTIISIGAVVGGVFGLGIAWGVTSAIRDLQGPASPIGESDSQDTSSDAVPPHPAVPSISEATEHNETIEANPVVVRSVALCGLICHAIVAVCLAWGLTSHLLTRMPSETKAVEAAAAKVSSSARSPGPHGYCEICGDPAVGLREYKHRFAGTVTAYPMCQYHYAHQPVTRASGVMNHHIWTAITFVWSILVWCWSILVWLWPTAMWLVFVALPWTIWGVVWFVCIVHLGTAFFAHSEAQKSKPAPISASIRFIFRGSPIEGMARHHLIVTYVTAGLGLIFAVAYYLSADYPDVSAGAFYGGAMLAAYVLICALVAPPVAHRND